jgi:hypothetical protein
MSVPVTAIGIVPGLGCSTNSRYWYLCLTSFQNLCTSHDVPCLCVTMSWKATIPPLRTNGAYISKSRDTPSYV